MPINGDIQPFTPREKRPGAGRLNQLVQGINDVRRRFDERQRTRNDDPPINAAYILITGMEGGIGYYTATVLQWIPKAIDPSDDLTADDLGGTDGEAVVAELPSELNADDHILNPGTDGLYAFAHLTAKFSVDGRRVLSIMSFGKGIIDLRYSASTHSIEVTFDGSTWIPKVVFAACSADVTVTT